MKSVIIYTMAITLGTVYQFFTVTMIHKLFIAKPYLRYFLGFLQLFLIAKIRSDAIDLHRNTLSLFASLNLTLNNKH